MDTAHWPQGVGVVKSMEDSSSSRPILERRARPQKDQALNCPRRYWTEGGSLRNVPVGGGSRKNNKRSNSSSPSTSSAKKVAHDHHNHVTTNTPHGNFPQHHESASQNPKIHFQGQDLNLAYPPTDQEYDQVLPFSIDNKSQHQLNPSSSTTTSSHHHHLSAMELLKNGIASRGLASFMPMGVPDHSNNNNITMFSTGFPMGVQEFKPSHGLSFSLEGFESSGYGCLQGVQEANNSHARLLFPTDEDLKQQIPSTTTTTTEFDQHTRGEGDSGGYWNGMLGGGSW